MILIVRDSFLASSLLRLDLQVLRASCFSVQPEANQEWVDEIPAVSKKAYISKSAFLWYAVRKEMQNYLRSE